MKLSHFAKPYTLVLLFYLISGYSIGQTNQLHINQVKQRRAFVDSVISSYYSNPTTTLSHTIAHYAYLDGGGFAELHQDVGKKNIFQVCYFFHCDTVNMQRTYYFIHNRVVFVSIHRYDKSNPTEEKYYKNDKLIFGSTVSARVLIKKDKDLLDGYRILKDIQK